MNKSLLIAMGAVVAMGSVACGGSSDGEDLSVDEIMNGPTDQDGKKQEKVGTNGCMLQSVNTQGGACASW